MKDNHEKPPTNWKIESSHDDLNFGKVQCWLCTNMRAGFICQWCLRKGDFVYQGSKPTVFFAEKVNSHLAPCRTDMKGFRYIDKKMHLIKVEAAKIDILTGIADKLEVPNRSLKLMEEIDLKRQKLVQLNQNAEKKISGLNQMTKDLQSCQQCCVLQKKRNRKISEFVEGNKRTVSDYKKRIRIKQTELAKFREEWKKLVFKNLKELQDILPTKEFEQISMEEEDNSPITAALVEASNTSYHYGKWIETPVISQQRKVVQIVQSRIPLSVTDSLFQILDSEVTVASLSSSMDPFELTNCILPGLAYSAQLTNLYSYFLNIKLPKRVSYRNFVSEDHPQKLKRYLCRLTFNLLYLAQHRQLPMTLIDIPYNPVKILHLLMEDHINNRENASNVICDMAIDYTIEDDDSFDEENEEAQGHNDWEPVTAALPSIGPYVLPGQSSIHVAASFVTSAAAGVASLWRGFAGK